MVHAVQEGAGPCIVFTHGLGGSLETWRHQAEALRLAEVPDNLVIDGIPNLAVPVLALVGEDDRPEFHAAADTWRGGPAG